MKNQRCQFRVITQIKFEFADPWVIEQYLKYSNDHGWLMIGVKVALKIWELKEKN